MEGKQMKTIVLAILMAFLLSLPANSMQTGTSSLVITNQDVVKMVEGGVADSTIVAALNYAQSAFDTSPAALGELSRRGVSPSVLEAMMRTNSKNNGEPETTTVAKMKPDQTVEQPSNSTDAIEPPGEGVYYKGPNGWIKLQVLTQSGGGMKKMGKVFVPGLTPHIVWTFRGGTAPIKISERRPTFYIKQSTYLADVPGQTSRDVVIVKFDKKKDRRELQATSGGSMFTLKSGFSKERTPDIQINWVGAGVFSVTPEKELPDGEYFLTFGFGGFTGHDFAVIKDRK
jgi:hypothetical protein